jgi:hypothetical protein
MFQLFILYLHHRLDAELSIPLICKVGSSRGALLSEPAVVVVAAKRTLEILERISDA